MWSCVGLGKKKKFVTMLKIMLQAKRTGFRFLLRNQAILIHCDRKHHRKEGCNEKNEKAHHSLVRPRTERKSMLGRRRDTPRVVQCRLRKGPKYKVAVKNKIFFLFSLLSV